MAVVFAVVFLVLVLGSLVALPVLAWRGARKLPGRVGHAPGCCPRCGSSKVHMMRHGFSAGKALVGAALIGPVGAVGGAFGANQAELVCAACGNRWRPGKG